QREEFAAIRLTVKVRVDRQTFPKTTFREIVQDRIGESTFSGKTVEQRDQGYRAKLGFIGQSAQMLNTIDRYGRHQTPPRNSPIVEFNNELPEQTFYPAYLGTKREHCSLLIQPSRRVAVKKSESLFGTSELLVH